MTDSLDTSFATWEDLKKRLAEVGLDVNNIAAGTAGPRIDVAYDDANGSRLVLVVTVYALNGEGKKYIDSDTTNGRHAAIEVRRFFITSDWRLASTEQSSVAA